MSCAPCNATKSLLRSRCMAPDKLLLQRPRRLDRIEVRRVWRQVEHLDTAACADLHHARIFMGGEIVHYQDVTETKLGQQLGLHPPDEVIFGGLLVGRREHDPAVAPDRAQQVQVLAPVHRHTVDELRPALHPSMAAAHREVETGLVEEHQPLEWNPANLHREVRPLERDVRPLTLQWPSALFFTTYPCRASARFVLET